MHFSQLYCIDQHNARLVLHKSPRTLAEYNACKGAVVVSKNSSGASCLMELVALWENL